ncbi:MAG: DUF502 domain-containing protein, partial [Planctomycetota bacterium]
RCSVMRFLTRLFLRGLAAVLPVGLTIYIVYWLATTGESLLRSLLLLVLPEEYYITGMGFVLAVSSITLIGALNYSWVARSIIGLSTSILERVPLVRAVYGMIKDMMRFFVHSEKDAFDQVVMVQHESSGMRALGFITRSNFDDLPAGIGGAEEVAVYVPMSYQLGGFMLVVPKSSVQPVDMSMDQALRLAVTAGMASNN